MRIKEDSKIRELLKATKISLYFKKSAIRYNKNKEVIYYQNLEREQKEL